MALKDWKKRGKTIIGPVYNFEKEYLKGHRYNLQLYYGNKLVFHKTFKTKSQALKFAKAYMKTH